MNAGVVAEVQRDFLMKVLEGDDAVYTFEHVMNSFPRARCGGPFLACAQLTPGILKLAPLGLYHVTRPRM